MDTWHADAFYIQIVRIILESKTTQTWHRSVLAVAEGPGPAQLTVASQKHRELQHTQSLFGCDGCGQNVQVIQDLQLGKYDDGATFSTRLFFSSQTGEGASPPSDEPEPDVQTCWPPRRTWESSAR